MKKLKFEKLNSEKFMENKLNNFKLGKILGGDMTTKWANGSITKDAICGDSETATGYGCGDVCPA